MDTNNKMPVVEDGPLFRVALLDNDVLNHKLRS
jgi:hypothetical protein